jgi:hypothetical protein
MTIARQRYYVILPHLSYEECPSFASLQFAQSNAKHHSESMATAGLTVFVRKDTPEGANVSAWRRGRMVALYVSESEAEAMAKAGPALPLSPDRAKAILEEAPRDAMGRQIDLQGVMTGTEIHAVRAYWLDHAPGSWSFNTIVRECAR